ncbi:hypothetical protein [Flavobacterium restrictum]|uniref:hypothetical protein n=1 Tax=Flavobacterium restrictum TaxID=2594428 RepID=UPI00163DA753|nr:hypothetical protein [Flavobacterium restrictum]
MKKILSLVLLVAFTISATAQEAKPAPEKAKKEKSSTKKETTKKECKAEGKKCCAKKE